MGNDAVGLGNGAAEWGSAAVELVSASGVAQENAVELNIRHTTEKDMSSHGVYHSKSRTQGHYLYLYLAIAQNIYVYRNIYILTRRRCGLDHREYLFQTFAVPHAM